MRLIPGTPRPLASDPRTAEQEAALTPLTQATGNAPSYCAGKLMTPNGVVTGNLAVLDRDPASDPNLKQWVPYVAGGLARLVMLNDSGGYTESYACDVPNGTEVFTEPPVASYATDVVVEPPAPPVVPVVPPVIPDFVPPVVPPIVPGAAVPAVAAPVPVTLVPTPAVGAPAPAPIARLADGSLPVGGDAPLPPPPPPAVSGRTVDPVPVAAAIVPTAPPVTAPVTAILPAHTATPLSNGTVELKIHATGIRGELVTAGETIEAAWEKAWTWIKAEEARLFHTK